MRKRVGVARAIAIEPRAILYDEPTTGLDPANQKRIGELIRALQRRLRITSVVVTHELELCFAISNRVALLKDGRIAAAGSADEMRRSAHPDVVAFLAGRHDASEEASAGAPSEQGVLDGA
jgi:phospholipid/cholesterol/gamma-HCH transport system ATP-binding protein